MVQTSVKSVFLALALLPLLAAPTMAQPKTHQRAFELIGFAYYGPNRKENDKGGGVYPIHNQTSLSLTFDYQENLVKKGDTFVFRFKVGNSKIGSTKRKIWLTHLGKEIGAVKGARKSNWATIEIPAFLFKSMKHISLSVHCSGDALHIQRKDGLPYVELIAEKKSQ